MKRKLSPSEMAEAKKKLARDRGIGVESISDDSVYLAIDAGNVLLSDLGGVSADSSSGINSISTPLSHDPSPSFSSDSGSSGGGCD